MLSSKISSAEFIQNSFFLPKTAKIGAWKLLTCLQIEFLSQISVVVDPNTTDIHLMFAWQTKDSLQNVACDQNSSLNVKDLSKYRSTSTKI